MDWISQFDTLVASKGLSDVFVYDDGRLVARVRRRYEVVEASFDSRDFDDLVALIYAGQAVPLLGTKALEPAAVIGGNRFRVSYCRIQRGRSLNLRYIPPDIKTPEERLIPSQVIKAFLNLDSGLVLVGGEMGSGKSTVIQSLVLAAARAKPIKIDTAEDPIESEYPLLDNGSCIDQREIGLHCESFCQALKEVRRRQSKLIVIGEVRDEETAADALRAGMMGAVVVGSIHGADASDTVRSYLEELPESRPQWARASLAACLKMVVATKLPRNEETGEVCPIHEVLFNLHGKDARMMEVDADTAVRAHIRDGKIDHLVNDIESKRLRADPPFYMQRFEDSVKERIRANLLPREFLNGYSRY